MLVFTQARNDVASQHSFTPNKHRHPEQKKTVERER